MLYLITIGRGSSVVERKPEELSVVGSIPIPGTILRSNGASYGTASLLRKLSDYTLEKMRSMSFEALA